MHIKRSELKTIIPFAYDDGFWGVYKKNCARPESPLCTFTYKDDAQEWVRGHYGTWEGIDYTPDDSIEIKRIKHPIIT